MQAGLIVVAVLVGVVLIIVAAIKADKKRVAALEAMATELGWTWEPEADTAWSFNLDRFALFKQGGRKRFREGYTGMLEDIRFTLFNHRYTVSSGKNSTTYFTTANAFQIPGMDLPAFFLRPEHFFHKVAEKFGAHDIDFDDDEAFSRLFRLTGDDEPRIRDVFIPTLRETIKRHEKWSMQADRDTIVIYQQHRRLKPEEIPAFQEDAMAVLLALIDRR